MDDSTNERNPANPSNKRRVYFSRKDVKEFESEFKDILYDTSIKLGGRYQAKIPDLDLGYFKNNKKNSFTVMGYYYQGTDPMDSQSKDADGQISEI